jgi:hypothetical protein
VYQRVHQGRLTEHQSQGSAFAWPIRYDNDVQLGFPFASVALVIAGYRTTSVWQNIAQLGRDVKVLSKSMRARSTIIRALAHCCQKHWHNTRVFCGLPESMRCINARQRHQTSVKQLSRPKASGDFRAAKAVQADQQHLPK